jgi:hypothetical protein
MSENTEQPEKLDESKEVTDEQRLQTIASVTNIDKNGWAKPLPETLPRPTAWPITLALGVTLLAFGIVTQWIISIAGLVVFLVACGGWFGDLRNDLLL